MVRVLGRGLNFDLRQCGVHVYKKIRVARALDIYASATAPGAGATVREGVCGMALDQLLTKEK